MIATIRPNRALGGLALAALLVCTGCRLGDHADRLGRPDVSAPEESAELTRIEQMINDLDGDLADADRDASTPEGDVK